MITVPNEIILLIFAPFSTITDKRQFLRTCINYNNITKKSLKQCEDNFTVDGFRKINNYCVEKFTLELCYDKYLNMIPLTYLTIKNQIIIQALATFGTIELLQIVKNNGCDLESTSLCQYAAGHGNINILNWAIENGCTIDRGVCFNAVRNNHLYVLKWARNGGHELDIDGCHAIAFRYNLTHITNWLNSLLF
jgi:hypothetical protein